MFISKCLFLQSIFYVLHFLIIFYLLRISFNKWIIKNKNDFFLLKNDHCILASKRLSKKYKFNISVLKFLYQSWKVSVSKLDRFLPTIRLWTEL